MRTLSHREQAAKSENHQGHEVSRRKPGCYDFVCDFMSSVVIRPQRQSHFCVKATFSAASPASEAARDAVVVLAQEQVRLAVAAAID